jgi:hypothetical protein
MTNAKGGSFYQDVQNLAVPFGLLLAAHGVGYVSKKFQEKNPAKASKQEGGAKSKRPSPSNKKAAAAKPPSSKSKSKSKK